MHYSYLPAFGSVVGKKLDPFGLVRHVGILVPHPVWGAAVVSFTLKGKVQEPVQKSAGGYNFDSVEYPSDTPANVVVWRALATTINRPYNVATFNCDYFVRHCHGLELRSPQVERITVAGLFAALIAIAITRGTEA